MGKSKAQEIRIRVIDRWLKRGNYSNSELMERCNEVLENEGRGQISSRQTIVSDIDYMKFTYNAPIKTIGKGKNTCYTYSDKDFSIYNLELSEEEHQSLKQALDVVQRFKGMPQFEWVDEMEARFRFQSGPSVVGFEDCQYNAGIGFFSRLFEAITQKQTLTITYQKFLHSEPIVYSLSPYYLKQYNNRWFLFGRGFHQKTLTNFPLDRIVRIERCNHPFEATNVDFDSYFDDVIGVTVPKGEKPEPVELWFTKRQLAYVETKPLHRSQKIVSKDEDGGIVHLFLIINYELEQLLLSFGENVKVLSPTLLQDKIKERIEKSLQNY